MRGIAFLFILVVELYLSGCASAHYKTESAFGARVDKKQPLSIIMPDNASVEEANFGKMLGHLMAQGGYSIIGLNTESTGGKSCAIFYSLDEPTYQNIGSYTTYNTSTSHTNANVSGFVGGSYVYGRGSSTTTTTTPQTHTYTYYTTYKKIYMGIGCLNSQNKVEFLWNGSASAEIDDYQNNKENTIKNLIALIQEEKFQGNVRISTDKNLEWVLKNQRRKHYLTIGADIGFGFVSGSMESISLAPYGYSNHISLDNLSIPLAMPITLRVGYLREFNNKSWSLGINALYTMGNIGGMDSESSDSYYNRYSCYESGCPTSITDNRIGVEVIATRNIGNWGLFAGLGVTKGLNSSINITIIDSSGVSQNLATKLDSLYPIWRAGVLYTIPTTNFGITWDINGNWALDNANYISIPFATNLGIFYKI